MDFGTIVGVVTHPIAVTVISAIGAVALKQWSKYSKLYKELMDIPRAVLAARKTGSPGGASITQDEYAEIGKEIVEAVGAAAPLIRKKTV